MEPESINMGTIAGAAGGASIGGIMLYNLGMKLIDALSRKWKGLVAHMMVHEWKLVEDFVHWKPFAEKKKSARVANLRIDSGLVEKVLIAQS